MGEFTAEELAGLSEEERQAILQGEEAEEGNGVDNEDTDADHGEQAPVDTPGEAEGSEDPATPGETPEGDNKEKEQQVADSAPKSEDGQIRQPPPFVPTYQVDAEQWDGIQRKLAELDQQLEEGDIDIVEYTRQRDPLIRQQTQIELAQQFNAQQAEQLWKHEQSMFFSQNQEYRTDPVLNGALRSVFKQLDTEENAGKSGYELLLEAKQLVETRIGGAAARPQGETKSESLPRNRAPARGSTQLPKTLVNTIPADVNSTNQDEFAHLDMLEGLDYERALAKLTPDQERRYLGGA